MNSQTPGDLIPAVPFPWRAEEPVRTYNQKTLYEYIDGGAELFNSYGLVNAASRKYIAEGQPEIVIDIFDMGTPANAYGVFCHVREETNPSYGQGAQVYDDAIIFWKGKYYVSIMAYDITPEEKEVLPQLATTIDTSIHREGALPEILSRLPVDGLDHNSILYFHHYVWQNSLGFLADSNFLPIDVNTPAVLANYLTNDDLCTLLLVEYATPTEAQKALKHAITVFSLPPETTVISHLRNDTWMGATVQRRLFVLVFQGKNKAHTLHLLQYFKSTTP